MKPRLKPCPLCGSDSVHLIGGRCIVCARCGLQIHEDDAHGDLLKPKSFESLIVRIWNRELLEKKKERDYKNMKARNRRQMEKKT